MENFKQSDLSVSKYTNKKNQTKYSLLLSDNIATKLASQDSEVLEEIAAQLDSILKNSYQINLEVRRVLTFVF